MTDNPDRPDLAFLRAVAERGAKAPLLGGRFLCFWGGLVLLAYLAHYLIVSGQTPFGEEALAVLWLAFGAVGVGGNRFLARGLPDKPGSGSIGNVVERDVWRMVGIAIAVYVGAAVAAISLGGAGTELMDTIMTVAFLLYAIAFAATGKAADIGWFRVVSAAALALAAASLVLIGRAEVYLLGAAGVLLVAVLPGLVLLRGEPPAVPKET